MSVAELSPKQRGRVVTISEPGALGERLLEMGLTPGAEVAVVRTGPSGDPMQIQVRGGFLSLRRALAESVRIEPL